MIDPADTRFFKSLQHVCAETEGVDPACRTAIDRAVETGDPRDLRKARQMFDALDPAVKDGVLRRVHAAMATDLSAIWDMLPAAGGKRPN